LRRRAPCWFGVGEELILREGCGSIVALWFFFSIVGGFCLIGVFGVGEEVELEMEMEMFTRFVLGGV
jgi:hypothetical protein